MAKNTTTLTTIDWYLSRFRTWESGMNGASKTALHTLRKNAIAAFGSMGFPTTRDEEWRFTNVAPIAATAFAPALGTNKHSVRSEDVAKFLFAGVTSSHLVFVNGHFSAELSSVGTLPAGVRVESLARALEKDQDSVLRHLARHAPPDQNAFTALNTAFVQDGALIVVPDGVEMDDPIHLLFIASGTGDPFVQNPRNLIVAGNGCRLAIVETYHAVGDAPYLTNVVSEVIAGDGSVIEHDKLQTEQMNAYHVGTTHLVQGAKSTIVSNSIALGGKIVRNNVSVRLAGEGSECTLNGLSVATADQLIDNHTSIDHAVPNCSSHELYKSILDGESHGVFNGKIFVRRDAQKTDAKQTNKTLLLSDGATIDTKPQLEIFADDVKCTHGATVGQLDDDQVFYLRARGIGEVEARDILTFAFAADVASRVHVEPLRVQLDSLLHDRLGQGRVTGQD